MFANCPSLTKSETEVEAIVRQRESIHERYDQISREIKAREKERDRLAHEYDLLGEKGRAAIARTLVGKRAAIEDGFETFAGRLVEVRGDDGLFVTDDGHETVLPLHEIFPLAEDEEIPA